MLGLLGTFKRQQEAVESHFQRPADLLDGDEPYVLAGSAAAAAAAAAAAGSPHQQQQQRAGASDAAPRLQQQQRRPSGLAAAAPESELAALSLTQAAPVVQQQQRPPLPPQLTLMTTAGSTPRELPQARDLVTCHSTCSSIGTCSSFEEEGTLGPLSANATPGGGAAAPTPHTAEPRSVSFASTTSRRGSLLSDSARASRRELLPDTGSGCASPVMGSGAATPAAGASADDGPWWASRWSFGTHSEQNTRQHMEDRLAACDVSDMAAFAVYKRAGFFAVFDGHSGAEAAEYLQEHLLRYLAESSPEQLAACPGAMLGAAVERAEADIIRLFSAAACNAGSTLLAALLLDDKLHVANVGDCRAVLARGTDAIQITTDHKPQEEAEAARIAREHGMTSPSELSATTPGAVGAGPAVVGGSALSPRRAGTPSSDICLDGPFTEGLPPGSADSSRDVSTSGAPPPRAVTLSAPSFASSACPSPVVTSDGYLYGELAVARALGSQHLKRDPTKRAFTHVPDIFSVQLVREDDMVLLASDGLWDKVENSEAVMSARRCMAREKEAGACARALVDRAVRHQSTDNISVVVVALHDRGISLPKTNSMLFRRLQQQDGGAAASGAATSAPPSRPGTPSGSAPTTPPPGGSPAPGGLPATAPRQECGV